MYLHCKLSASFLMVLLLAAESLPAQPKVLTLNMAREFALERNLNVVQAQNNVSSAQAAVLAAQGGYLPTVAASAGWNRTQTDQVQGTRVIAGQPFVVPGLRTVTNYFSTGVDVGYTIFDWFRRESTLSGASSTAVAAEQGSARTRQTIVFQVEQGYLNVLRNEQLVKVSDENLRRDMRQLERIEESNRVGALALADVYRQQSQVAQDELSVITAQNNYDKAKADLMALIGLDGLEDYQVSDTTLMADLSEQELAATAEKYKDFTELTRRAVASRPDYIGATETYNAAESGVTSARSGYFPSVSASAGYGLSNAELSNLSDNKSLNWGLSVRWNVFDGFQTNQSLQAAIAGKRNAEISLKQAERDINVQIKKALLDLDAARKALDVTQKGLVSAEEDRKIAEERYNLGAGTLLDLLVASAGLVNAQAGRVNASYDYIIAKRNVEYSLAERTY